MQIPLNIPYKIDNKHYFIRNDKHAIYNTARYKKDFYGSDPIEVAKHSLKYKILKLYTANVSAGALCENTEVECKDIIFDTTMLKEMGFYECEVVRVCGDSMEGVKHLGAYAL